MTDQYTQPIIPTQPADPVATSPAVSTEPIDTANQPNPASVYDQLDKLSLSPEELALSGAVTQAQVSLGEESAEILKEMQAVMEQEKAEEASAETPVTPPVM